MHPLHQLFYFITYLCRYQCCRYTLVLIEYCSLNHPIHRNICIAIHCRHLPDIVRVLNNYLGILPEYNVCHSIRLRKDKCRFYIGRVRYNGHHTISCCNIAQTNQGGRYMYRRHNDHVHHNLNRTILRNNII